VTSVKRVALSNATIVSQKLESEGNQYPLIVALRCGQAAVARVLLECSPNLNVNVCCESAQGSTALHLAVGLGKCFHIHVVKIHQPLHQRRSCVGWIASSTWCNCRSCKRIREHGIHVGVCVWQE
jgi:hypothetical protein